MHACAWLSRLSARAPGAGGSVLRTVRRDDAVSICGLYNHYVVETPITFEEAPVTPFEMEQRIEQVTRTLPWLVCEENGKVMGYAYAGKWKERAAYRNSVELTVYLDPSFTGKGRGSALIEAVLAELSERSIHCVIGGVALPNPASVALLEKFGLRKVAHFSEVGYKFGKWIDVGYWQRFL
jgi:L-amino acid N-acyltransferase YncA